MVDVLELARQRRVELVAELEKLDWFLNEAETLLREHSETASPIVTTETAAPVRPTNVATPEIGPQQTAVLGEESTLRVQAPEEGKAAQVSQRPIDTIVFKKMLTEMGRRHRAADSTPVREEVAATA